MDQNVDALDTTSRTSLATDFTASYDAKDVPVLSPSTVTPDASRSPSPARGAPAHRPSRYSATTSRQAPSPAGTYSPPMVSPPSTTVTTPPTTILPNAPVDPVFALEYAPVYRPTADEFRDPLAYIASIRPHAEKYGLAKIIPPSSSSSSASSSASWRPPFAIDPARFRFHTRRQRLNAMDGRTRVQLNFLEALAQFHAQQNAMGGKGMERMPMLRGRPVDLYMLSQLVWEKGGYYETSNAKLWQSLAERMKLALPDQSRTFPVGHFLRNQYARWVLPFEIYCGRYADGQEVTVTLSVAKEDEEVGNDAHEDDCCASDDDECPEGQDEQPATTSTTTTRRSGRPRAVPKHYVDNQEPLIVRRRKTGRAATHRKRGLSTAAASSSTVSYYAFIDRVASLTAPPPAPTYRAPSTRPPSYVPGELCELCYDDTVCGASILLCDGCDLGYHPTCLPVPLDAIPDGDWFCPRCMAADDNFGFEEGGEYTLEEFRRKANAFKTQHFAARKGLVVDGAIVGEVVVSEEEMEREFWRLSSSTFEALEVDYGADLHSSVTGSGFPTTLGPMPDGTSNAAYVKHDWNLNNIAKHARSLLKYVDKDISGMVVPWLYVGMAFSTFCWHTEDHWTYSINYLHQGAPKTWYGIPSADAERFEHVMRQELPALFSAQPDLLFHITTMMSPEMLRERGVRVVKCEQRAGEFVVTFPRSYHAGFNQGFNFAEAVNFAPKDWFSYGTACLQEYRRFGKMPVFSHDELLLRMLDAEHNKIEELLWLRIHLEQMHANEMERRIAIRKRFGASLLEDIVTPEQATTERIMCAQCKTLSYLSQVVVVDDFTAAEIAYCTETTDVCIHKRPTSTSIVLRLTYSDTDLARVVARVTETLAPMQKWIKRYRHYIASHPTVDVATIKRFLAEANRLQITVGDEVADVKRRVASVTDWHVRVQRAVATRKRTRLGDAMQATTVRDLEGLLEEAREKGWESGDIGRLHEAIKALVGEWVNEVSEMVRVVRDPPPPKGQRGGGRKKVVKEKAGNVVTASTTVAPSEVVASATNNLLMTEDPASSTLNFSDVLVATAEDMWTGSVNVPSQQEPCTVTTPTQTPTPTSISPESSSSSSATAAVVDPLLDEMTILNVQQCKQLIDTATRLAIPTDHPVLVRLTEQVGLDAAAATELSFSGEDADAALSAFDFAFATTSHGHAQ